MYIALSFSTWTAFRLENARRDKLAETNPEYATGEANTDVFSGLRYGYISFTRSLCVKF